jgi:hypothetical protein
MFVVSEIMCGQAFEEFADCAAPCPRHEFVTQGEHIVTISGHRVVLDAFLGTSTKKQGITPEFSEQVDYSERTVVPRPSPTIFNYTCRDCRSPE